MAEENFTHIICPCSCIIAVPITPTKIRILNNMAKRTKDYNTTKNKWDF